MTKIIGISGRKQSGKNTCANYINGHILKSKRMIENFSINPNGELEIQTYNSSGTLGWGVFDLLRKDSTFIEYAHNELWPFVKTYHFADELKSMCYRLFGIKIEQVYGSDDQKNELTNILWDDMPENNEKLTGPMTAREFMQHFGTNVIRKIKDDAWVECTIANILYEQSNVAIIPDVRFPNEVHAIHQNGGVVIRLTRDIHHSDHKCEIALDQDKFDWQYFDYIVDNEDKSIEDLSQCLNEISDTWSI